MRYNKKTTLCLLVCLLMAFACAAVADTGAQPILFRDLPWGATYAEAMKAMPEGLEFEKIYLSSEDHFPKSFEKYVTGEDTSEVFSGPIAMLVVGSPEENNSVKVAGYELDFVILVFAYTAGEDKMLAMDEEHTALVMGLYEFLPMNPTECYNDLTAKLTMLYGEPEATVQPDPEAQSEMRQYTAWRGAEESHLYLSAEGIRSVELAYWSAEGEKLMQEAYDALMLSVDGL